MNSYDVFKEQYDKQRRRDEEREFYELTERVQELEIKLGKIEEHLGISVEKVPEHYECKKK